jgi:hypothetical protein
MSLFRWSPRIAQYPSLGEIPLTGHLDAKRAYAWSYERPDGKRRFFAVLHGGGITGPREDVRAAIVAEARRKQ